MCPESHTAGPIGLNIIILQQAYIQHTHTQLQVDWVENRSLLEPSPNIKPLQYYKLVVTS